MRKFIQLFTVAIIAFSASILSADIKPAVIYDMGGKFDKSFNESVYNGAQRFTKETGIKVMEFEVTNEAQREQGMRKMAQRGANVIVCVGFAQADACDKVAKEFPNTKFSIIDVGWLDNANMRQYVFKEHEGSFLVGALAAMASKTGKVGFVGGMDIPLIRKFACGYVQGAKAVNSKVEVYQNMTGTTLRLGMTRQRDQSSQNLNLIVEQMLFMPQQGVLEREYIKRQLTQESWRLELIVIRTTCIRAQC